MDNTKFIWLKMGIVSVHNYINHFNINGNSLYLLQLLVKQKSTSLLLSFPKSMQFLNMLCYLQFLSYN